MALPLSIAKQLSRKKSSKKIISEYSPKVLTKKIKPLSSAIDRQVSKRKK